MENLKQETKNPRRRLADLPKRTLSAASSVTSYGGPKKDVRACVVIEIGRRLTKIGLAGEFVPSDIFPTQYVDALARKTYELFNDSYTEREQYFILANFFKEIVFRRLLTTINERRVMIVESVLTPTRVRDAIARALFECPSLAPDSVLFAPSHLLCSFTFNAKNCVVVDIGSQETLLFPIAEGCLMLAQYESTPLGAVAVEEKLRALLLRHARIRIALTEKHASLDKSPLRSLTDNDIQYLNARGLVEDMVVRFCFATTLARGQKIQRCESVEDFDETPVPDVELSFGTDTLILPGFVREAAAEVLFTHGVLNERSIPQIILDVIMKVPIDLRRVFLGRLLVVGGLARMRGFLARLKAELVALLADAAEYARHAALTDVGFYRFEEDINQELYCGWLGGSMFASCDVVEGRAITLDDWLAQTASPKSVPDWTRHIDSYFRISEPTETVQQRIR